MELLSDAHHCWRSSENRSLITVRLLRRSELLYLAMGIVPQIRVFVNGNHKTGKKPVLWLEA